jgi:anti-anti-sigma regulatory factor
MNAAMIHQEPVSRIETILVVDGPLSGDLVDVLHERLTELSTGTCLTITLDLSSSPVLNSAAIGKLLFFSRKLAESRKTLRIRGCSEGIYRIFKALQLDKLMEIDMSPRVPGP